MKKNILISIVAAGMLLAGCSHEDKKSVSETAAQVVDEAVKAKTEAVDMAKDAAAKAEAAAKAASEATAKAVEATKAEATQAVETVKAEVLYAKCAGCHGKDGKTLALGKSAVIAGQSKEDLLAKLKEYKAGTRDVSGMGTLMKGQVAAMSDADLDAVAAFVAALK
jgi:cytochrome c553